MSKTHYPKVYDRYNHPEHEGISFEGPGLTRQEFKDECDVNIILTQFQNTGILPPNNRPPPQYGDFSNVEDYHEAHQIVINAQRAFMDLPAHVRSRFDHDPAKMLQFLEKEENRPEAVKLGLVNPPTASVGETQAPKTPTDSTLSAGK